MATLHLIIQGKVQGVFYRASTRKMAKELGITGWVRNTPEGYVEIMAHGVDEQVKQFVEWCKKGPSRARVDQVKTENVEEKYFKEFIILRYK